MAAPIIFSRMFLNKHKLHNLIKRKFCILTTTKIKNKNKTHTQIYKVYNCLLMSFHILKLLHDSLIINATSYISFNIHNQLILLIIVV